MDSMNDNDESLPIDFNMSTQLPRVMDGTANTAALNEASVSGTNIHTMKDHEMHISELKKENFELKLRIYFLEEKLDQFRKGTTEDVFTMNIELKVENEKLKTELAEKRCLLVKASTAVDSLDRNNQEQIKKLRDQHNVEMNQAKQGYESRIRECEGKIEEYEENTKMMQMKMRENNEVLKSERTQSNMLKNKLVDSERINRKFKDDMNGFSPIEASEKELLQFKDGNPQPATATRTFVDDMKRAQHRVMNSQRDNVLLQAELQATLAEKQRLIDELKAAVDVRELHGKLPSDTSDAEFKKQIKVLNQKIEERETKIQEFKDKMKKTEAIIKDLRQETHDKERKLQLTMQAHTSSVQKNNEKLQQKQTELDQVQEKFRVLQQNLEKAQEIIDEASLKDVEAFEEKSKALKAKDALIAELQGNLKERSMENDHLNRSIGRKDVELQKLLNTTSPQKKVEQQLKDKEDELMALTDQLAATRSQLREISDKYEAELQQAALDHQNQLSVKDEVIRRATETLDDKESIIQDLIVTQQHISLSSSLDGITDSKEELIQKLRDRLKERDEAVETNIEDKFQSLREKEGQLQELRKGLRERDRLIENINATVLQHEDVLNNLQSVIAEKDTLINDLKVNLQTKQNEFEQANKLALKRSGENEGLIEKLKRNLANRDQQIENLKTLLQRSASKEASENETNELVNELSNTLKEKEKLLSDMMAERSQMIAQSQENEEQMTDALLLKGKLLEDVSEKMEKTCTEKNTIIARLQQQVNSLNLDTQSLENSKAWAMQEQGILLGKVRQSLAEKERTIEKLIQSGKEKDKVFLKLQECTSNKATSPVRLEVANLKNTVQDLDNKLQEKQDIIERLERANREHEVVKEDQNHVDNLEYTAELEMELEHRDSLLKQAAESIEAFKTKFNNLPVLEELKKKLADTEQAFSKSETQRTKLHGELETLRGSNSLKIQSLEQDVALLKQEREMLLSQVNKSSEGESAAHHAKELRELLQKEIEETAKIREILHQEYEAYRNMVERAQMTSNKVDNVSKSSKDLDVISRLRQTLEDGIVENNKLRVELHQKITTVGQSDDTSSQSEEITRLQAKLEDSERWNMSLQSRLDALQPRARGVGGSERNQTTLGSSPPPASKSQQNDVEEKTKIMKEQVEDLKCRLDESQKMNGRLQKQLDNMSRSRPEELSGQNRLNEQQKHEINLLREELVKSHNVCDELRTAAKKMENEMSIYKKEHQNEFNSLKKALEDSQKFTADLQEQLSKQKDDKENQTSFDLGEQPAQPERIRSPGSPARSSQSDRVGSPRSPAKTAQPDTSVQQELEEMYRKNEELRRTLSAVAQLDKINRKLKQELMTSQQQTASLEQQVEETGTKLDEMTSEVVRLQKELDSAHALNIDFASQLKRLRDQVEEAGSSREALVMTQSVNEKLKNEVERLLSAVEHLDKENKRLKGELDILKNRTGSPVLTTSSPSADSGVGLDSTDAGPRSELQSLRKKLDMSEKLNAALKYELDVKNTRRNRAGDSGEPLLGHVEELRQLRSRLEESIKTYDALCLQLEEKLSELNMTNGASEAGDRALLVKENEQLHIQLGQFTEKMKKIQSILEEQRISGRKDKEQISLLHSQLVESNNANGNLRKELAIYEHVLDQSKTNDPNDPHNSPAGGSNSDEAIILLMNEIRSLRKQLEASIESNNSLRQMLQNQLSLPQRHVTGATSPLRGGLMTRTSPGSSTNSTTSRSPERFSSSPVLGCKGSDTSVVLESVVLDELRQNVNSGFHNSESLLIKLTRLILEGQDKNGHLGDLKKEMEKLRSVLFKSNMLLDRLWAQQLSSGPTAADRLTKQNEELLKEVTALKKRVLSQSKILENTATRLESSSRMRKEVERSLFARLGETRQTLGDTRQNLQDRLSAQNSDVY